jgi:hypothetical protein
LFALDPKAILLPAEFPCPVQNPSPIQLRLPDDMFGDCPPAMPGFDTSTGESQSQFRFRAHGVVPATRAYFGIKPMAPLENFRADSHVGPKDKSRRYGTLRPRRIGCTKNRRLGDVLENPIRRPNFPVRDDSAPEDRKGGLRVSSTAHFYQPILSWQDVVVCKYSQVAFHAR